MNFEATYKLAGILLFLALLAGCQHTGETPVKKTPVARVGENYLYEEDIPSSFLLSASKEDSIKYVEHFIRQWVTDQLIFQKARLYLPQETLDNIEKQVEKMREDLMIYHYEQELILQKLDTVAEDTLVEKFYNDHLELFSLKNNIVKVIFIKIPAPAPNLSQVRQWYRSNRESDLKKLENYCYQYAMTFDDFEDHWVSFDFILDQIPLKVSNQERFLQKNQFLEAKDSVARYFVRINEYRLRGTTAPLEYVSDEIVRTLLNERKLKFLREMENNIYFEALNGKKFEIYK